MFFTIHFARCFQLPKYKKNSSGRCCGCSYRGWHYFLYNPGSCHNDDTGGWIRHLQCGLRWTLILLGIKEYNVVVVVRCHGLVHVVFEGFFVWDGFFTGMNKNQQIFGRVFDFEAYLRIRQVLLKFKIFQGACFFGILLYGVEGLTWVAVNICF